MISYRYRNIKDEGLRTLKEFKIGSWVNVENPSLQEITALSKLLGLEESLIHDALDVYEAPRIEVERGIVYVFTRYPVVDTTNTVTLPILIVIGEQFFLTVCTQECSLLAQTREMKNVFSTQKTKLFLQVFSQITSAYTTYLHQMNKNIRMSMLKLERITNNDIVEFVRYEGILSDFLYSMEQTHTVLKNVLSGKFLPLYDQDEDLAEDIVLNYGQLMEMCRSNLRTIANIRAAYSTITTNTLNRTMKLLTSLTILVTIPTMISSLYGMNVALPGSGSSVAFYWIIGFIVGSAGVVTLVFMKNKWL
ncbi:MAG: magnesium transporter CorA family protein [Patescibacteria group bacterium]